MPTVTSYELVDLRKIAFKQEGVMLCSKPKF